VSQVPTSYLLALAALAVSFVGFSSLVIMLRQVTGGAMSRFDAFLTRTFVQLGFLVAAGSLLPQLLGLSTLSAVSIWKVASLAEAVPTLVFATTYPYRRRLASGVKTPPAIWGDVLVLASTGLALLLNGSGLFFAPGPLVYAAALTLMLCLSAWAYLQALQLLVREHLSRGTGKGEHH